MNTPRALNLTEGVAIRVVAAICLVIFAMAAWRASGFPPAFNPADIGPARVPYIAAGIGGLCGLWLLVGGGSEAHVRIEIPRSAWVAGGALAIVLFGLLMSRLGFYPVAAIAVPSIMAAGGERRWIILMAASLGFLFFVYLCFDLLLNVEFP